MKLSRISIPFTPDNSIYCTGIFEYTGYLGLYIKVDEALLGNISCCFTVGETFSFP